MKPALSFRHLRTAVIHRDDSDGQALIRQLGRLGCVVNVHEPDGGADLTAAQVVFFDGDLPELPCDGSVWPDVPTIALVGSEAPSRLKWILAHEISAHLMKPVRTAGVYTTLAVATHEFARRRELRAELSRLETKVRLRRVVFSAQIKLMQERGLDEEGAFTCLRQLAMEHRCTIEEVSLRLAAMGPHPARRSA